MHLLPLNLELTKYYVAMKDGTIQEVEAGCYKLTSDGYWTFYKERTLAKLGGTVLHSIDMRAVKGIYNAEFVTIEAKMDKAAKGNLTTEVRKMTAKKSVPKASKTPTVK